MQIKPTLALKQKRLLAMTPQLQQAIGFLQLGASDLNQVIEAHCDRNPLLRLRPPARVGIAGPEDDPIARLEARPGLHAHVRAQLGYCSLSAEEATVAQAFIDVLEPSGWISTGPEDIARRTGVTPALAAAVLAKLQRTIEPTGLFAQGLAECLRLQLGERGALHPALATALDHLEELARLGPDRFADTHNLPIEALRAGLAQLRALNPKPGSAFDADAAGTVLPDLIARRGTTGWEVELNSAAFPHIEIDATVAEAFAEAERADAASYREAFGTAQWLLTAIARRQKTLLRVGTELVRWQSDFLDHGRDHLRPLKQKDIAARLKLSESTVSRVAGAAYVQTPQAVLPLKRFFCQGPAARDGAPTLSAAQIQARIREIITAEDPTRPLSDTAIAEQLDAAGIALARRTVAKYRAATGLPARKDRRRTP